MNIITSTLIVTIAHTNNIITSMSITTTSIR